MPPTRITMTGLQGVPLIKPGDDLGAIAVNALGANEIVPEDGDVLVVAQKIVSKAERRFVEVADVEPSARAVALAAEVDKDPRFVEVVLAESKRVVRHRPGLLIVEHRLGLSWRMPASIIRTWRGRTAASESCCCPSTRTAPPTSCGDTWSMSLASQSGSSSATASAGLGARAPLAWPSVPRGCRRSSICAASRTSSGGSCW